MSEYTQHKSVADYLKLQYHNIIFTSDSSGIRLTIGSAVKMLALKSRNKIPDLLILEPRGGFAGLIIEMKDINKSPFKKDGELKADKHLIEQADTLKKLNKKGYSAVFATGFDEAVIIINNYMALPQNY